MSPPQRRSPVPPDLMDEILGEILLRIPPEEPAHLIRFALVCKPWLRVLSDPAFRRGYRERHRRPPLLGFVHNLYENGPIPRFVPTTASRCSSPVFNCQNWWALDSRHGRVLVNRFEPSDLVVWDPVSGDQQHLPLPPYSHAYDTGAVLCAAASCDHLDCSSGQYSWSSWAPTMRRPSLGLACTRRRPVAGAQSPPLISVPPPWWTSTPTLRQSPASSSAMHSIFPLS
ncbi:uncharacterized protein LOC101754133 [Setaria italica]|uniref:uncharacterized protein LOC101754133 n=1 Tax=Setaria italica TaxID=4555 RepID=UPI000350A32C|nr:uncharacterized protein LOC101754133 [Setaria italica]